MPALECSQETKAFRWTLWSDKIIFRWHYGFLRKTSSSRNFCCRSRIVRCQISSNAKILKAKQQPISIFLKKTQENLEEAKKKKVAFLNARYDTTLQYDWGRLPCGPEFDEFLMTFDFHDMFMTMMITFPAPLEWLSQAFFLLQTWMKYFYLPIPPLNHHPIPLLLSTSPLIERILSRILYSDIFLMFHSLLFCISFMTCYMNNDKT